MSNPNFKALAMRDAALAALVGAIPGADFGAEDSFGAEYGDDYGSEFGFGEFGAEFGGGSSYDPSDIGVDFGYGAPAVMHHPHMGHTPVHPGHASLAVHNARTAALWQSHQKAQAHSQRRGMLLEPNKGSSIKVERYTFSVNQSLVLGTPSSIAASGQPDTNIRPQQVTMNAPQNGFATINTIKVANVSVSVGGTLDAFQFSSLGVGRQLDMPTLTPANRASVLGDYTGYVPPGFLGGAAYLLCTSFTGPASIVA